MAYFWPSIVQLVLFGLITLLAVIQTILGIVGVSWGYWPSVGAIIHGAITVGYCVFVFVCHRRSHVTLVHTKSDVIVCFVLAFIGLFIGIFCGTVAIGTFVLLLGNGIYEVVFVATRKEANKWNTTLYDVAALNDSSAHNMAKNPNFQMQSA